MDPKLSKLVKTAVKEGKKKHHHRDHHSPKAFSGKNFEMMSKIDY